MCEHTSMVWTLLPLMLRFCFIQDALAMSTRTSVTQKMWLEIIYCKDVYVICNKHNHNSFNNCALHILVIFQLPSKYVSTECNLHAWPPYLNPEAQSGFVTDGSPSALCNSRQIKIADATERTNRSLSPALTLCMLFWVSKFIVLHLKKKAHVGSDLGIRKVA